MKKHIARMVTAVLMVAAFAGILSACASENAVEMQNMLDELIADFTIPAKPPNDPRVQAFQRSDADTLVATADNPAPNPLTFRQRVEEIDEFYDALTVPEREASGMSRVRKNFNAFKTKVNDYRAVSAWVTDVDALVYLLIMGNPNPALHNVPMKIAATRAGEVWDLEDRYLAFTKEQRDLYASCDSIHASALTKNWIQIFEWKEMIDDVDNATWNADGTLKK
ncbi:MAG: hypothetical protein FWD58_00605 [Firmicutes bacterium]|nr:hypothetical protein [Bacillota bacterium]